MVAGLKGINTAHGQVHTELRHNGVIFLQLEGIASVQPAIALYFRGVIRDISSIPRQNYRAAGDNHTTATAPKDIGYLPKSFRLRRLLAGTPTIQQ
jgi:hypothetical protein